MTVGKKRIDQLLVERGLAESRQRARAMIMAGEVQADGRPITKPGLLVREHSEITIKDSCPFVSRGGMKLESGLRAFQINVHDLVCLDVGASTGGFTDCLLQNGAGKVFAVDVGYGQLAWKLRQDDRVVVIERANIRYLPQDALPEIASAEVRWNEEIIGAVVLYNYGTGIKSSRPINQKDLPGQFRIIQGGLA